MSVIRTAPELVLLAEPDERDREAIVAPLIRHNQAHAPPSRPQPLAIALRGADGHTIGGLWGKSVYDWLFVELLAVPEALRGQGWGQRLLAQAEATAGERGCAGIWLDTFAFQARGFYEKLGYRVFGQIDDHPRGSTRYFLSKSLPAAGPAAPGT